MPLPAFKWNDYVSIAVMLLMAVALIAGQADASTASTAKEVQKARFTSPMIDDEDRNYIEFSGSVGERAVEISINIVKDLGHFRGEDE